MTLREAIGQYIAWRRAQGARFQSQAYALRRYCRRVGDGVDCDAVRSDQVSAFLASGTPPRATKSSCIAPWRASTVTRSHAALRPVRPCRSWLPRRPRPHRPTSIRATNCAVCSTP